MVPCDYGSRNTRHPRNPAGEWRGPGGAPWATGGLPYMACVNVRPKKMALYIVNSAFRCLLDPFSTAVPKWERNTWS